MSKCLLCRVREANKKGSHIIPSFLMKRINSMDGCDERDHEVGFAIGPGTVDSYFGREVYEDKRRELTNVESRIEDRTNLDTMDNVFCPECETLFSKYESKYSRIYNLPFENNLIENTIACGSEAAIFWYSVIWRISATEHSKVRLKPEFEEKLRQIVLSGKIGNSDIYYSLHYCKDYRIENPTFALFDCCNDVATLVVDEFMLMVFNGKSSVQKGEMMWGVKNKGNVSDMNNGSATEKIALFPISLFKQINDSIMWQVVKCMDFRGMFNAMHRRLFGWDMSESIFQEIIDEVHKAKLADMYTIRNYALSFKKVIQEHPDIYKLMPVD